jgi:hypothetical protein
MPACKYSLVGNLNNMLPFRYEVNSISVFSDYAIQTFIHEEAKATLNIALPFTKQDKNKVKQLQDKVISFCIYAVHMLTYDQCLEHYPVLRDYQDDWVTLEFIKRFLKNSSSRHVAKSKD